MEGSRFQIDVDIDLTNCAPEWGWPDLDGPRPDWMRQGALFPCGCKKCFFCIHKLINKIDHHKQKRKLVVKYNYMKRLRTGDCILVRVQLFPNVCNCKSCVAKKNPLIKRSSMGYGQCVEPIYEDCWVIQALIVIHDNFSTYHYFKKNWVPTNICTITEPILVTTTSWNLT
jgi:hypothetical protein